MLLVVAESSGSSPGRQGYKMAVAADGQMFGSIGGGVMEVSLVEIGREILANSGNTDSALVVPHSALKEQVHREGLPNSSGMICSGKQSVIFKLLRSDEYPSVLSIIDALRQRRRDVLVIAPQVFAVGPPKGGTPYALQDSTSDEDFTFEKPSDSEFIFSEQLGFKNHLSIIGGGHCALALSELMSRMDFHISLFDDRPELNTLTKNEYAHDIKIVDSYERISDHISSGQSAYVVVMTLGYKTDEIVIRCLIDKEFKYFGVLGSKAKMATMLRTLRDEGVSQPALSRIRTPIGLPINSRTPDEIAVSIAAEIISVKNAEP